MDKWAGVILTAELKGQFLSFGYLNITMRNYTACEHVFDHCGKWKQNMSVNRDLSEVKQKEKKEKL